MPRSRSLILALIPLALLASMIYYLMNSEIIFENAPLPVITMERIEFKTGKIIIHIRNTGQDTITIAQVDVNDSPLDAVVKPSNILQRFDSAIITLDYRWIENRPYEIGITTSDGTRTAFNIEQAKFTPEPSLREIGYFALLGSYVGVIPVILGLLWFPFIKRIGKEWYDLFLSLTAGLLVFLAIDAINESLELADRVDAFNEKILIPAIVISTFLLLLIIGRDTKREGNADTVLILERQGLSLSYMIAIGIGLHNLGEGLAIGAAIAIGSIALSKFLMIGFTIHNTTEGLAIIAPIAKVRAKIKHLAMLGLVAGAPTIAGTWLGGFTYIPLASIAFLAIGAGAILQVVYAIFSWMKRRDGNLLSAYNISGFVLGMVIMYLTGLISL